MTTQEEAQEKWQWELFFIEMREWNYMNLIRRSETCKEILG